ncbi:estradiol 17-beta-dehydrogenase 11-like isoform X1 [Harmonia axyridis]|uniref:estradiol 17-beta-dehydrogenase 11-like isoform X1 n=1 Tax=Harmonia axyridis TaxID=115357 RepID=UPI001E2793EF|nr:estradiol 17-beta-dehydrogenase 11-like isoform X1 [Harmonia axyridis]
MAIDQESRESMHSDLKTKKHKTHPWEKFFQGIEITLYILRWFLQMIYYLCEDVFRFFFPRQLKSVEKEIVLITGTGHGIGKELAFKYAQAGAIVVGWDFNKENNENTFKEINEKYGKRGHPYTCDVSNLEDIKATAKKVSEEVGDVTILIANAGILYCRQVQDYTPMEMKKIIDTNVMQLLWLIHVYFPIMVKNSYGHIVGISSVTGLYASRNMLPYSCSKYAVRGIMEALREEIRADKSNKVKTTVIYPYMVNTGMIKVSRSRFQHFLKMLEPEDVAEGIIAAQRTEMEEVSIPGIWRVVNNVVRILPRKAIKRLIDLLDAGVEPDPIDSF